MKPDNTDCLCLLYKQGTQIQINYQGPLGTCEYKAQLRGPDDLTSQGAPANKPSSSGESQ